MISGGGNVRHSAANNNNNNFVISLVDELLKGNLRENALSELSKQREQIPDLAVILWNRVGMKRRSSLSQMVFNHSLFYI